MANAIVNVVERRAVINLVGPGAALAMNAADVARVAAAVASSARDGALIAAAAKGVFPDVASGISGTAGGDYFYAVTGSAPDKSVGLFLNSSGSAEKQTDLATIAEIVSLQADIAARPTVSELAQPTTAANVGTPDGPLQSVLSSLAGPIEITAHRGFRRAAPENTLTAWSVAISMGYGNLETDIQMTADGVPILMHDSTVDRTTDGTGSVGDLTLAQIKTLDAGIKFGAAWAGTQVPTLEEALLFAKGRAKSVNAEIKTGATDAEVETIVNMVISTGMASKTILSSFQPTILQKVRQLHPTIPIGMLDGAGWTKMATAIAIAPGYMILDKSVILAAPANVATARAGGLDVLAYAVETWGDAEALLAVGVSRFVTDTPL